MLYVLSIATLLLAGCSLRSTYPTLGAIAGGGVGSLGGPGGAALGAGTGALAGEALKNADALVEAEEKTRGSYPRGCFRTRSPRNGRTPIGLRSIYIQY